MTARITHPSGHIWQEACVVLFVKYPAGQERGTADPTGQCKPLGQGSGAGTEDPRNEKNTHMLHISTSAWHNFISHHLSSMQESTLSLILFTSMKREINQLVNESIYNLELELHLKFHTSMRRVHLKHMLKIRWTESRIEAILVTCSKYLKHFCPNILCQSDISVAIHNSQVSIHDGQ